MILRQDILHNAFLSIQCEYQFVYSVQGCIVHETLAFWIPPNKLFEAIKEVFLQEHSTFNYVVPLTMLSLNLDIHRVVKNHNTIHYLSPQGEGKQSSLLSLLVIILLSGSILFKIICQRIIWSHIILNAEWNVSPFTCR